MKRKIQQLATMGAGEFEHLNGTLIDHLKGTRELLKEWGAPPQLQDAGLFHAAYGTAGFDENLVSIEGREDIAKIIGAEAEEIVYTYCACDRQRFFEQFGLENKPKFINRFNAQEYYLSDEMLKNFCELTAANEVEISLDNLPFKAEHGAALNELFLQMAPFMSSAAKQATIKEFGDDNSSRD